MSKKDFYQVLGLERNASKDEIKKAFRLLAAKYHPDKATGDETKFKEISEAYSVLGDEKKRAEYDAYGHAFSGAGGGQNFNGFGNWQDFAQAASGGQGFEFDIGDIFGEFFGGGGGSRRHNRGRDISIDLELSFEEAVFGIKRSVLLTKQNLCEVCNGNGAKPGTEMKKCETCNGNGKIRETRQSILGSFQTVRECSACNGTGQVPKQKCESCSGMGVKRSEEEIEINVPPGIEGGEMIRMTGRGEAVAGGTAGDLYIKIHVRPHSSIKRDGNTLESTLHVKLSDALMGNTYAVATLDGVVEIKIPAGVTHGERLRIRKRGVPKDGGRGDFMVKVLIDMPKKLSRRAKKLIEELKEEGV